MSEIDSQEIKRRLVADRGAGRIGEAEYRRRLEDLIRDRRTAVDATRGSSLDASTVLNALTSPLKQSGLKPGDLFDEYRLVECVGAGAFGYVWKAYNEFEDRHVALKILPPELSRDASEMEHIRGCFHKIHHLHHEHICPVYGLARQAEHGYYLVMQFVQGVPLTAWRESFGEKGPPIDDILRVLSMAAGALDYAHRQKVVHRDVKPSNLLCTVDGQDLQIVDFGLAEQIHSSMSRVSGRTAQVVGTPAYMSPEACSGTPQDGCSDQYGLACVAYYLLAGRPPFVGHPWVVVNCHREQTPRPIAAVGDRLNQSLLRGLAKRPDERFSNCVNLVNALRTSPRKPARYSGVARPGAAKPKPAAPAHTGFEPPQSRPCVLVFARNSGQIAVAYRDGTLMTKAPSESSWVSLSHELGYELQSAVFTPEGGFLVLNASHQLCVVNSKTGRTITTAEVPKARIIAVRAVDKARQVCCATDAQTLVFVDLASGKLTRTIKARVPEPAPFAISHDGKWLAACGPERIVVHSLSRSIFTATMRLSGKLNDVAAQAEFAPDDRFFAACLNNGKIQIFDVQSGRDLVAGSPGRSYRGFAFSPDGQRVLAIADDEFLHILDTYTGQEQSRRTLPGRPTHVAVSETGRVAVALPEQGVFEPPWVA